MFPLPNVKLTWGNFDLFADKMTAEVNPHSECYEVTTGHRQRCYQGCYQGCLQVTIHKVLEHQQLPSETTFGCEIEIPGTDYFVRYILNGFNHHSLFLLFEHVAVSREEAQYDQHQAGAVRRRRSLGRDVMVQELRMRNISTDHLRF